EKDAHVHPIGPPLEPAEPPAHAGILAAPVALEHELVLGRREVGPRHGGRDAAPAAEFHELTALPGGRLRRPGLERAVAERAARIRYDEVQVEVDHAAEAATRLARP